MRTSLLALLLLAIICAGPSFAKAQSTEMLETCPSGAAPITQEIVMIGGVEVDVADVAISLSKAGSQPTLTLRLGKDGALALGKLTTASVGKSVDLAIGQEVLLSPFIREPIWGGKVQISGDFTVEQLEEIAERIQPKCAE